MLTYNLILFLLVSVYYWLGVFALTSVSGAGGIHLY